MSLLRQPQSFFAGIAEGYRQKRDLLVGGLREIEFAATPPQGAYYLFADYRDVLALGVCRIGLVSLSNVDNTRPL